MRQERPRRDIVLGLNAYHGDSAACLLADGELVAAVEEERFTRIKHWAGLPAQAARYCLSEAGISLEDVAHVAVNRNPRANYLRKALFAFTKRPDLKIITDRLKNAAAITDIRKSLCQALGISAGAARFRTHHVEHHLAHLASSFHVSPFHEAACVSIDGFGDFVGSMYGFGQGARIAVSHRTFFPHSLGLYYSALTQYLGFPSYGDEYKVMGLAAYGEPTYLDAMRRVVRTSSDERASGPLFELDLDCFIHHNRGVTMTWEGGEPKMGPLFGPELERLLGPKRRPEEPLTQRHKDIAASLQARYEEVFFHILNLVHRATRCDNLTLSGGCAMNSVANGKIFTHTPFKEVYIQPAAGDAGGAIGAACQVWYEVLGNARRFVLTQPYLGPRYSEADIQRVIAAHMTDLASARCDIVRHDDPILLCSKAAALIAEGRVLGWFQGRMEWGPRALGNRSILCDPRRHDIKDLLNRKIKRRESFRPFAPSIHVESVADFFETSYPDPFMLKVYKIRPEKRPLIPAVTHVDGTGRLQSVSKTENPLYWRLIDEFRKLTGVPVLLNTSFNENEPIVCRPEEALACFLRTKMDVLVLGSHIISRSS